jgi:hypothetical protein
MNTSERIAIGALVCSIGLPVLSFWYLDQQIKGFNDRQLVYKQKTWAIVDSEGPEGSCVAGGFAPHIAPERQSTAATKVKVKPKAVAKRSSDDCRTVSTVEGLTLTLDAVGKLPVSQVQISVKFQGTLPPDRFVNVKITPPVNTVATRTAEWARVEI